MARGWKVTINASAASVLDGSAMRGVAIAAEHLLGVANEKVPIEEATLLRSGTVSTDPGKLTAAISYDTPYAARQHEDMSLRHDSGRTAKWLENAMNAERATAAEIIAATIRGDI